jgi:hypothetical protein
MSLIGLAVHLDLIAKILCINFQFVGTFAGFAKVQIVKSIE